MYMYIRDICRYIFMEVYVYIRDAYVYIYSANLEQINEFKYSSESCMESER